MPRRRTLTGRSERERERERTFLRRSHRNNVAEMADKGDDAEILETVQGTYVPFLKKLIAFLEKNKKATPDNLSKLKAIYSIFTTASSKEQVETFRANKKKLQDWYKKAQKDKSTADGGSKRGKRSFVPSDTESSQGISENTDSANKKQCTFSNAVDSDSQPSILLVQSVNQNSSASNAILTPSQIKKEKMEGSLAVQPTKVLVSTQVVQSQPAPAPAPEPAAPAPASADGPITFTCASCQFQTLEETEFMKHARTDHRTDLSMWCKQCGKCFSNAGVLVSHIKERACVKEEMIYKCGVKDCVFETTSGQTFVHHLRHCHKGSPFIFCVHCQKIFTLPHCLILHMQDDCPYKDRNRRNPTGGGNTNAQPVSVPKPTLPNVVNQVRVTPSITPTIRPQMPITNTRPITPRASPIIPSGIVRAPASSILASSSLRGRSRGRGRGRGRARISDDSSDSDDPDDPSWRPEESLADTGLRRSSRWAKKINDVMNPEPSTSGVSVSASKKSFTSAELKEDMIKCPCCEYLAAFQTVLEDHYIATHKVQNKCACSVCHLKFENTRSFLDHFEEHRKGLLPSRPPAETVTEPKQTQLKQIDISDTTTSISTDNVNLSTTTASNQIEPFDEILSNIDGAKITNPITKQTVIKIPYQAAIHDKNLKDSKLKKFEELKSPNDLITMKTIQKLKHFFKCGLYGCAFTSDSTEEFSDHVKTKHADKKSYCCYCLKDFMNGEKLANHIAFKHKNRAYQCSKCFYRAHSKGHVQIHIKNAHGQDPYTDILVCDIVQPPNVTDEEQPTSENMNTTWPYICAVGECDYSTYDPKEFKKHSETMHRTVSVFLCHYCKVDFLTFKRLLNHYRLHGLNVFQCNYCIHGAETNEEILLHLCNAHADEPLKAFMRGSVEEVSSEMKQFHRGVQEESNGTSLINITSSRKDDLTESISTTPKERQFTGCENELFHVIDNKCYPQHMQSLCYPRYLKSLMSDITCGLSFCNERFENMSAYIDHLRKIHDALNFPCPYCPEMCDSWNDLKDHLYCHGSKLYACRFNECEFYDYRKENVKNHTKIHENAEEVVVTIREFSSNDDENKLGSLTIDLDLPDVSDTFTCWICQYKCSNLNVMKNHLYKELAYQRFDCSLCDKKCYSRREIKDHFIKDHPKYEILCSSDYNIDVEAMVKTVLSDKGKLEDVKLAESCDMCCRKFKNPLRLQSHLYICLQKEYRPYECLHCKKNFVNILAVKYHTDDFHHPKLIDFSFTPNSAIEEDIEKNLLKVRMKQLTDVFEEHSIDIDTDEKSFNVKFYTCSECPFEAYFKYNVDRHINEKHEGNAKVMKGRECKQNDNPIPQIDENSNDSTTGKSLVKRYSCTHCVRKMLTIQEVEKHIKKSHSGKNTEVFYYYTPDTSTEFSSTDKEIYECAYCKSTQENLFSLKKHADLMHSEMEFKVKGFLTCNQSQYNYLACGYCYLKVKNHTQLQEHSAASHPLLALKSIGDFQANKNKRVNEASDDIPNKRVKFNSAVYVCTHCGGAFSSIDTVTAHSKRAHSRIPVDYKKMDQSSSNAESADFKFYKCEFCRFTSEKHFLDKHLAAKHKMRVTCSYCNKRFEFASKLKEHHDGFHKDLPIKYSQETVSQNAATPDDAVSNKNKENNKESESPAIPKLTCHYGRKPEPIDLDSITVHMKTNEGSADLPLVYVTERFNLFPIVLLKDVMKKDLK